MYTFCLLFSYLIKVVALLYFIYCYQQVLVNIYVEIIFSHLQKLLKHQLDRIGYIRKPTFKHEFIHILCKKKLFLHMSKVLFLVNASTNQIVTNGHQIPQLNYILFSMDMEFHLTDCPSVLPHLLPVSSLIASHGNTTDSLLVTVVTLYTPPKSLFPVRECAYCTFIYSAHRWTYPTTMPSGIQFSPANF